MHLKCGGIVDNHLIANCSQKMLVKGF